MTAAVRDVQITGVHPYADAFPMASEDEIEELTASVAAHGQYTPGVVAKTVAGVADGRLADGRNRREACRRAGVEFMFEERDFANDDELKEFVIGVNTTGRRESMTVQIAAASTALILGEERRVDGRWDNKGGRGKAGRILPGLDSRGERLALTQCGLVLDILGRAGVERVRDGQSLNSVYEEAQQASREAEQAAEQAAAEQQEEDQAREFIEANRPDLAAEVGVNPLVADFRTALALHEQQHREEARKVAEQQRREAEGRINALNAWKEFTDHVKAAVAYPQSKWKPPNEIPKGQPSVKQVQRWIEELAESTQEWE